jgi:hypothetical protein
MAEYPQKTSLKVQMRGIQFGSQITHLEESTKTNHPLNRTLVVRNSEFIFFVQHETIIESREGL